MRMPAAVAAACLLMLSLSARAGVPKDNIEEYGRGIIADYSDMTEGEDIEWLWVKPGVKLGDYRYQVDSTDNLTVIVDDTMDKVVEDNLPKVLERAGSHDRKAPLLHVAVAVYWAERANISKAWIPWAGGHQMQAGVGIELVAKDAEGNVVAKIRQSGREGMELALAAQEVVDDIAKFVRAN
jgi:hypothetical protein